MVLSCEVLRAGIPASPYVVPETVSIIPLPLHGLRRVSASENGPFLPEIGRNLAIFGNPSATIGRFQAESSATKHIMMHAMIRSIRYVACLSASVRISGFCLSHSVGGLDILF